MGGHVCKVQRKIKADKEMNSRSESARHRNIDRQIDRCKEKKILPIEQMSHEKKKS